MSLGIYDKAYVLGISPLTPLHMGMGRAGGTVDLPVQRDSLGLPIIYASSLKGAFKSFYWGSDGRMAKCLFGPEPRDDEKYASPVSFLDGILVLIPVREASGGIVMATSQLALGRLLDYLELAEAVEGGGKFAGEVRGVLERVSGLERGAALSLGWVPGSGGRLFVAGRRFSVSTCRDCDLKGLSGFAAKSMSGFAGKVVVFSEEDFKDVVEGVLIRLTRVRVDREKKTVVKGGLWTEEYVPQGSIFVSVVLGSSHRASHAKACNGNYDEHLRKLLDTRYLIIGGKESTGKGVVKTSWARP